MSLGATDQERMERVAIGCRVLAHNLTILAAQLRDAEARQVCFNVIEALCGAVMDCGFKWNIKAEFPKKGRK